MGTPQQPDHRTEVVVDRALAAVAAAFVFVTFGIPLLRLAFS
jgi:hypothetical protein